MHDCGAWHEPRKGFLRETTSVERGHGRPAECRACVRGVPAQCEPSVHRAHGPIVRGMNVATMVCVHQGVCAPGA